MPAGVMYYYQSEIRTIYFSDSTSVLPIKLLNGEIKLLVWGRHKNQAGELPLGGWARLESIYQGQWDIYSPKPVKLPIIKFMEKDFEGITHWYEVPVMIGGHVLS
jgi:hypothetical protein